MNKLVKCKVITQNLDETNYNENGLAESFLEFQVRVDSDVLFYAPKEVIELTFQKMIDETMRDFYGNYVYVTHEVIFHEPMQLKGNFDELYQQSLNELHLNEN